MPISVTSWLGAVPGARPAWRALLAWRVRFFQGGRFNTLRLDRAGTLTLLTLPEVFNGVLLRSGRFLAGALDTALIPRGSRVLDMGTGSGIGAIRAAQLGASVVAVDINPEAVRCARINTLLNHVEDRVEVRPGDLFAPVRGERFDVILFNPPFFRGAPRRALDYAWRSENTFERFLSGLDGALAPRGSALILLSTDGDLMPALTSAASQGWRLSQVAQQDLINEVFTLYRLERGGDVLDDAIHRSV